ncbi:hypothetical protein [Vibrio agarivorans]|uniref:hypothetical protein n=1 Tax=Vibrio agarivorans TaxID=153622 RepID=UPI00222E10E3|nr:hypothetical protein [Vibrio agarivorans]
MKKSLLSVATMVAMVGCSSVTERPATNVNTYAVYQVDVPEYVSYQSVTEAIKVALNQAGDTKRVVEYMPPAPLPKEAPRFTLVNPVGSKSLKSNQAVKRPSCVGALVYAKTESINSNSDESLYTCLWKYQQGYHLDFYYMTESGSSGLSSSLGSLFSSKSERSQQNPMLLKAIDSIENNLSGIQATAQLLSTNAKI